MRRIAILLAVCGVVALLGVLGHLGMQRVAKTTGEAARLASTTCAYCHAR